MTKKTKISGKVTAAIAVLVLCFIILPGIWGYIAFFAGGIGLCFHLFSSTPKQSLSTEPSQAEAAAAQPATMMQAAEFNPPPLPTTPASPKRLVDDDIPVPVITPPPPKDFAIPAAPTHLKTQSGPGRWIPPGERIVIAGHHIKGGMIYVGTELKAHACSPDPCLINPVLSVAMQPSVSGRGVNYWPSYTTITPAARLAYLNWLAGGRCDPEADIGDVFLFFYGLERRVILDGEQDEKARRDRPLIAQELRRLLAIYGEKSSSFNSYASRFLNWLEVLQCTGSFYNDPVPSFPKTYEIPLYIRLALGRAAVDKVPVPAHLALAWVRQNPNRYLRTPATRCVAQFDSLFIQRYADLFKPGLILPRNKTKLKVDYHPASAGFSGTILTLSFGEIPDVTVLTAPQKKLNKIVDAVTEDLDAYSRYLGRNADAPDALEGVLLLPPAVWPETVKTALQCVQEKVLNDCAAMKFQELLDLFQAKTSLNKERATALAKMLETARIGIEPDILGGARTPKGDDHIVLYHAPEPDGDAARTPAYQMAALTLDLASAVASADGEFSGQEMDHLRGQVEAWSHLGSLQSRRLLAHLQLLAAQPVSLASLKKKLDILDEKSKETMAVFMATVAQADGTVTPAELKMLEKVYKTLGLESRQVFTDVHAVAAGTNSQSNIPIQRTVGGFQLDAARIAALQKDSEQVGVLLADIFKEDASQESLPSSAEEDLTDDELPAAGLFGLDDVHSVFVRVLLTRPQWARNELMDVCSDMELMLDGAIEQINDVMFDAHDMPFTQGDDPIEVNPDILEKLDA